ncbi:17289_t:CDS:1, partial [Gigaspora rosea]
ELTVTDMVIKSINNYRSHDREPNRIMQFVSFFEELTYDYELLKRM